MSRLTVRAVRAVLACGLLAILVAFAVLLAHSAPRRSGSDVTPNVDPAAVTLSTGEQACQNEELLPADTAALRMIISSGESPPSKLSVRASGPHGALLASGALAAGWRDGVVRIPITHVSTSTARATVCLRDEGPSQVMIAGDSSDQDHAIQVGGKSVEDVQLRIEYMRPGSESWLALAPTIVHRFSLGKAGFLRDWEWVAVLVLMALAIALAVGTILAAALIRRVPRAAWLCALVALANCLAWSLITPPFQVPDENAHYAYVAQVAERGTVPRQILPEGLLSPAEDGTLGALDFYEIVGDPHNPAPFSTPQQQMIEQVGAEGLSRRGDGDALTATNNPPLYYMLEAIPYKLAGGTVLDRLAAMRMLSALMGAVTVLLVYLFLMELLPGRRRTWSVGALAVAFQPMFGFLSGGVNSDDLIYLTAAGTLWAVARMFRRGLTPASGARIGAFLGLGLVTKFTLIGFIPAIALAVALGLWRAWPRHRARALRGGAWALGLVAAPVLVYLAVNRFVWKRDAIAGGVGSVPAGNPSGAHFSFAAELSHIWQLFLPPLWMRHQFNYVPLERTWFKGFIGRFGWLDYTFPEWFYGLAFAVTLLVGALALVTLVRNRRALAGRRGELAVYVLALVGLCVEIGVESYREAILTGTQFEQARYLLPLLGLYAAIVALATRAGGGRWGPVIGAALVMLALGHDLFAQAITIARYYS